ncbi:MAG TPA: hypothetical protein VLH10_12245 [Yinghuangia sp.]|nr:hypothetical protein [Yinghuangia sp.]
MTAALPLDLLVGPEAAAAWITARARDFIATDCLTPDAALRLVCERATDGDPHVLASPGQVWALPADTDPNDADAPADALLIRSRLPDPDRVAVTYLDGDQDDDADRRIDDVLLVDVLQAYRLHWWDLPALGPAPAAAPGQTWRRRPDADARRYPATELTVITCYPPGDVAAALHFDDDEDQPVTTLAPKDLAHYERVDQPAGGTP